MKPQLALTLGCLLVGASVHCVPCEANSIGDSFPTRSFRSAVPGDLKVLGERAVTGGPQSSTALGQRASGLSAPENFQARSRQLRVDLSWDPPLESAQVQIQRSRAPNGPFEALRDPIPNVNAYSDFVGVAGGDFYYRIRSVPLHETAGVTNASEWSPVCRGSPKPFDAEGLLSEVQEAGFRYFYDYGHPVSGLARVGTSKGPDVCSIGGTGWALCNLVVGAERGFLSRAQAARRVERILEFLYSKADRFHGAFPHWINGATGKTLPFSRFDDGADLVETAFLMEGVLLAREYFYKDNPDESRLRQTADELWRDVDWSWFRGEKDGRPCLMWHWSPNYGWAKNHGITGFNECHIVYVLAMASPTHAISPAYYWQGWMGTNYGTNRTELGLVLKLGRDLGPPLFWTQFSYLGLDPRKISYQGESYFDCFRDFCRVQVAYAKSRSGDFKGYGPLWGLSASRGPTGYRAFAPGPRDNGTLAPSAALGCMPYLPEESRAFLRELYAHYGKSLWGPFGFYDAFNFTLDWVSQDYLGNEVGPIAPMIENYRSGLCWKTFMKAKEVRAVLALLKRPPLTMVSKDE